MGIPIVYFRSSSFNAHRMCPMQAYIEYTLGIKGDSGKAACKGTITHKMLEICAVCKNAMQDGETKIQDKEIGEVLTAEYSPEYLNEICARVYKHYSSHMTYHEWKPKDEKDCTAWAWKALEYNKGMFDPMNRTLVDAEPYFDFIIEEDWAKYSYPKYNLEGHLGIKGTIDLITDIGDGMYEIIDWKTGQRKDWATGKTKDQSNMASDPQLRIYHYACKKMYPHVNSFLFTLFFINHGGPFTVHFQDSDLQKTEEILRKKFEAIKKTEEPRLCRQIDPKNGWKCKRLCHYGKTTFEDHDTIKSQLERRPGQYTRYNQKRSKCEQIRYMIKRKGIEWVTDNYIDPNHSIGEYREPGGTE